MNRIWRISKPATFKAVGKNIFTITFATKTNKQKVFDGRPWLFNNHLLILKQLDGFDQTNQIQFETKALLLRFYNLRILYMNRMYGKQICEFLDEVLDEDLEMDDTGWGHFLHIQIEINITKSLVEENALMSKVSILYHQSSTKNYHTCVMLVDILYRKQSAEV